MRYQLTLFATLLTTAAALAAEPNAVERAVQARINNAPDYGRVLIGQDVILTRPLDVRDKAGLRIECVGDGRLVAAYIDPAAAHWPILDLVGSRDCTLEFVRIHVAASSEVTPACAILLGRQPAGPGETHPPSAANHLIRRCLITGRTSVSHIYNVGSELDRVVDCRIESVEGVCYLATSRNTYGVTSPHGPLAGTSIDGRPASPVSDVVHWLERSHFGHTGDRVAVQLAPNGGFLNIHNCSFSVKGQGLASIYLGAHVGAGTPEALWPGVMVGNYAEYDSNYNAWDVLISGPFRGAGYAPRRGATIDLATDQGAGYPRLLELNPGFRRGIRVVDRISGFPHP